MVIMWILYGIMDVIWMVIMDVINGYYIGIITGYYIDIIMVIIWISSWMLLMGII